MSSKTALPIVFGVMTFGREGEEQVRTSKLEDCAAILDTFQSHGHNEIDTSRFYGVRTSPHPPQTLHANSSQGGSSEEYLKALNWQTRSLTMDTKFFPNVRGIMGRPVTHLDPSSLSSGLSPSLSVPLQETLCAVADLHARGKFSRWGVSNYMAWEVAAARRVAARVQCAAPHGGSRTPALSQVLRCRVLCVESARGRRVGGAVSSRRGGLALRRRQDAGPDVAAAGLEWGVFLGAGGVEGEEGGLREGEVALRRIMHHSQLRRECGDKVSVGASSNAQLVQNLRDFEKGGLEAEVLQALDEGITGKYSH